MRVKPNDPILAELRLGTVKDARWVSIGSNKTHGLPRTNADKRHAVRLALLHPEGMIQSNRQIAEYVGVDHKTVGAMRDELERSGEIPRIGGRYVQRGDQVYWQNSGGISFGRRLIPPGSTCAKCLYFEDDVCLIGNESSLPAKDACDDWELKVENKPNSKFAPPDYSNIVISDEGDPVKKRNRSLRQNRKLTGCQLVPLPPDNAQLFAVELRNRFSHEYLIACMAALKSLLMGRDE